MHKLIKISLLVLLAIFIPITIFNSCEKDETPVRKELVIASYGGTYQDAQRMAFFAPFEREFDVVILDEPYSGDLASIRERVERGDVEWDVVAVDTYMVLAGEAQNLYERIDYDIVEKDELIPEAIHDFAVGSCIWSTVLAYNTDQYNDGNPPPMNWTEFWDTGTFPGPRSLRNSPISTLEFALLADGVDKSNLYPLDVERAFESLSRIKNSVTVWWETGAQPAESLGDGEVVLTSAWNGRIFNARAEGKPVQEIWDGGLIDMDFWVIPKGSENVDLAMEFIQFASRAEQQAELPKHIPYGPANKMASEGLSAEILANLPTSEAHIDRMIFIDSAWWLENQEEVMEQWEIWLGE